MSDDVKSVSNLSITKENRFFNTLRAPTVVGEVVVVGDVVFALFDQVWYQGIFQELRPNNKRDKYFCRFEDGDKRSMNINSLFQAILEVLYVQFVKN